MCWCGIITYANVLSRFAAVPWGSAAQTERHDLLCLLQTTDCPISATSSNGLPARLSDILFRPIMFTDKFKDTVHTVEALWGGGGG